MRRTCIQSNDDEIEASESSKKYQSEGLYNGSFGKRGSSTFDVPSDFEVDVYRFDDPI